MPKSKLAAKTLTTSRPVESLIRVIRGQKVILDTDLAALYQVVTKTLNQAVRRNLDRFPEDFMFQLSVEEAESLRSQFVTSNVGRGGRRYRPYAFTEHGVVMLSSVLKSPRAVQTNIFIARAFVRLREIIASNKDLATRIEKLERGHHRAASVIEVLVEDIDRLAGEVKQMKVLPSVPKRRIGFRPRNEDELRNPPKTRGLTFDRCPQLAVGGTHATRSASAWRSSGNLNSNCISRSRLETKYRP